MKRKLTIFLCYAAANAAVCSIFIIPFTRLWVRAAVQAVLAWNSFGEVFAAVFGAFFGSLSAFYLGVRQQKRQRRDDRHEALLAAQYAVQSQWNLLGNIRTQLLNKLRSDPLRHTKLPVFHMHDDATTIPFASLIFLAKEDDPNLLQNLRLAEASYKSAMKALDDRNIRCEQFYNSPNVSRKSFDSATGAATFQADPAEVFLLQRATDGLYDQVDRALPKLRAAFVDLQKCIKRVFGNRFRALATAPVEEPDASSL